MCEINKITTLNHLIQDQYNNFPIRDPSRILTKKLQLSYKNSPYNFLDLFNWGNLLHSSYG